MKWIDRINKNSKYFVTEEASEIPWNMSKNQTWGFRLPVVIEQEHEGMWYTELQGVKCFAPIKFNSDKIKYFIPFMIPCFELDEWIIRRYDNGNRIRINDYKGLRIYRDPISACKDIADISGISFAEQICLLGYAGLAVKLKNEDIVITSASGMCVDIEGDLFPFIKRIYVKLFKKKYDTFRNADEIEACLSEITYSPSLTDEEYEIALAREELFRARAYGYIGEQKELKLRNDSSLDLEFRNPMERMMVGLPPFEDFSVSSYGKNKLMEDIIMNNFASPQEIINMLQTKKIVVLNLDTTGVKVGIDEIIRIQFYDVNQGANVFTRFVKPKVAKRWDEAQKIHGISPEVAYQGQSLEFHKETIQKIIDAADLIIVKSSGFVCEMLEMEGIDCKDKLFGINDVYYNVFDNEAKLNFNNIWDRLSKVPQRDTKDGFDSVRNISYLFKLLVYELEKKASLGELPDFTSDMREGL